MWWNMVGEGENITGDFEGENIKGQFSVNKFNSKGGGGSYT